MRPIALLASFLALAIPAAEAADPIRDMQADYVAHAKEKANRAYHWGSQGPGDVYSNHGSHSNRLIPVYAFGSKVDLGAVTGANSVYRDEAALRRVYGFLPENTLNPEATYADQSDGYRVMKAAVDRGVKHLFVVWFDGMDWEATRAAAVAKSGQVYDAGKGAGLAFQDDKPGRPSQYGYYVTAPSHDRWKLDVNDQTARTGASVAAGGYDARIAGPNPWTLGLFGTLAPGYLKGFSASPAEQEAIRKLGRSVHAYTDSAPSAAEFASGVKSYNDGINVGEDNRPNPTLFNQLQAERGWKVGTATSVPFDHASPAAFYAHNVHRDDYQDLARDMLGLPNIAHEKLKSPAYAGLDVVMGAGFGNPGKPDEATKQGKNYAPGGKYLADADLKAIDARDGGPYVIAKRTAGVEGRSGLQKAADEAAKGGKRLFGFYGVGERDHLPYRTADGDFSPTHGNSYKAEQYTPADLAENPTLTDMTKAALTVLAADPAKPFALFVEAGDVDFALHDNNLDNAIGAVLSGDEAVRAIFDWVETHSNWDDSAVIVTADHGHYLVLDDVRALAGHAK